MSAQPKMRSIGNLCLIGLLAVAISFSGCQKFKKVDTKPLYQSGMWSDTIKQLKDLDISESEVNELIKLHDAGLSDDGCVKLMHLVRDRKQMFTSGDSVAGLLHAGVSEKTVLELGQLDLIGTWALEAQGIRLSGYSDDVVLAVAHRRAKHLPTVSATSLVELKNTGVTEKRAVEIVTNGLTDEQAGQMIASHQATQMPTGFVRGSGRKHRSR
jgi:phosphotransferase system HPr-like phosphotransfer protein